VIRKFSDCYKGLIATIYFPLADCLPVRSVLNCTLPSFAPKSQNSPPPSSPYIELVIKRWAGTGRIRPTSCTCSQSSIDYLMVSVIRLATKYLHAVLAACFPLHCFSLKTEEVCSGWTSVKFYQNPRRHISKDSTLRPMLMSYTRICRNILSPECVSIDGVWDWRLDLLTTLLHYSHLTSSCSTIANLHALQITTARAKSFSSLLCLHQSFPGNGFKCEYSSASALTSLLSGEYPTALHN
jgi:hypothetical protein